jgi:hypothetical protein
MDDFIFNRNVEHRDELLGIPGEWSATKGSGGGIRRFNFIDVHILQALIESKYIDPHDNHNNSPRVEEIFEWMSKYPAVRAQGYAVSPFRKDYGVSLDTLAVPGRFVPRQLKQEFLRFCAAADEIITKPRLYAWWD